MAERKKLPVFATVGEAFSGAWTHFGDLIRIAWLPVLLYIAISAIYQIYFLPMAMVEPENMEEVMRQMENMSAHGALPIILVIASLLLYPMIAVAWHRFVLLGERPNGAVLRFGRRELTFVGAILAIYLLPLVPVRLVAMLGMVVWQPLGAALLIVGYIFVILWWMRMSLLLPSAAVDRGLALRDVWEMTRGNFWRIFAVIFLASLLTALLMWAIAFALFLAISLSAGNLASEPYSAGTILFSVVMGAVTGTFILIVNVAVLSIAYRELSGWGEAKPAESSA